MSSTNDTSNPSLSPPSSDEPASQWARSTLSALEPTSTDTTIPPEKVSSKSYPYSIEKLATGAQAPLIESPGSQVPGAFPGAQAETKGVEQDGQTVKRAMMDALETAKGYAYNAGGAAKDYAQSAGQAVGEYVPPSIAAYLPGSISQESHDYVRHDYSLPSQETSPNEHPFTFAGVGTLPGPANESSVALLPDERAALSSSSLTGVSKISPITTTTNNNSVAAPPTSIPQPLPAPAKEKEINNVASHDENAATAMEKAGGVGVLPGSKSEAGVTKLPEERRQEDFPSHDSGGVSAIGTTAGVGALPGTKSDVGVGKLPDERPQPQPPTQEKVASTKSGAGGASTDASTRCLAGSRVEPAGSHSAASTGLDSSQTQTPVHHDVPQTGAREHPLAADEEKKLGGNVVKKQTADTATPPPMPSDATPGYEYPPSGVKSGAVGTGAGGLAGAGGRRGSEEHKKAGFVDKLKGEMKVISGKLGHNEEKVEAGRKMMGKN